MKTFGKYLEEKNKGLWDNIHAKRKRGEKMRKPGSKGAPTDADFKRAQEESAEHLDELSPNTLSRYAKKADKQADKASDSYSRAAARRSDFAIDTPAMAKNAKKFAKRDAGAALAKKKLNATYSESADLDEVTVANSTAAFDLKKKAEAYKRIMVKSQQAKGQAAHDKFLKARTSFMNALKKLKKMDLPKAELDALRKGTNISESVDLDENITKMSNARLKYHATKGFPHGSYSSAEVKDEHKRRMRVEPNYHAVKPSLSEEVESIEEAPRRKGAPKMKGDSIAIQRAKDAELNKALGRTKTGRKKPVRQMTSTQRSLAQLRGESVQSADKKPEKYVKPDGKVAFRMIRTDKNVVDKDA